MYARMRVNTLKGYESVLDVYEVDIYGNVYGMNGMELAQGFNSSGYKQVALKTKGERHWKKCLVHRLVALSFVPNEGEKPEIDHIDGDRLNNYYKNLHWVTRKENMANPNTKAKMIGANGIKCYVYDFKLNFIGQFDSLDAASKYIKETIRAINTRTSKHYILDSADLTKVLEINKRQHIQSVVVTDMQTNEKIYFHSNRAARDFFGGRINVTQAIQKNSTVYGKYKVRTLNYKKLIGMLDL